MKNWKGFALLVVLALVTIVGVNLTIHAGEVSATPTGEGDSLFYHRYGTTSTTPITDLDELIGSGTAGASGQVKVHDGTDYEPKTITTSGDVTGTLLSTGDMATTLAVNTVESANIVDNSVSSADILNGTIVATDIASNTVTSDNILNATIVAADIASNTVTSDNILNATIADADLAVNAVTATKILTNTVTVTVTGGETGTEVAVEPGSILMNWQPVSGFDNDVTITKFVLASDLLIVNTDAGSADGVINAVLIRPTQ